MKVVLCSFFALQREWSKEHVKYDMILVNTIFLMCIENQKTFRGVRSQKASNLVLIDIDTNPLCRT